MLYPTLDGQPYSFPLGKSVCVGRNYAEHARELNNPIPSSPILFIKPSTAIVAIQPEFAIPQKQGEVHHELEIAVLIGKQLQKATEAQCREAIAGIGLALDLTLRDVQTALKAKGHPWELAKAFDGACPVGHFISLDNDFDLTDIPIKLQVNGQARQQGSSAEMLFPITALLAQISTHFTLNPGDLVLTGTPAGVSALSVGDKLQLSMGDNYTLNALVTG